MTSIKAHFDGTAIVPDEPINLAVGQQVRVIVEAPQEEDQQDSGEKQPRSSLRGFFKGKIEISDDFDEPLDEFAEYR